MEKKTKDQSIKSNIKKWLTAELERLASRGRDIDKFDAIVSPDSNELKMVCEEYTMKFIKDEKVIDLVVNGKKNSSIWDDVVNNVPVQFATCIDNPMGFTYKISSSTSDKKESYLFSLVGFNNFMPLFGLIPLRQVEEEIEEKRKDLDSMIADLIL